MEWQGGDGRVFEVQHRNKGWESISPKADICCPLKIKSWLFLPILYFSLILLKDTFNFYLKDIKLTLKWEKKTNSKNMGKYTWKIYPLSIRRKMSFKHCKESHISPATTRGTRVQYTILSVLFQHLTLVKDLLTPTAARAVAVRTTVPSCSIMISRLWQL